MKSLALLALLASLLSRCVNPTGDTYYVDVNHPSASDNNPGTDDRPWRSIVHAVANTQPGDRVWVMPGRYDHGEIEIDHSDLVLSAFPGHEGEAVISGAGLVSHGNSDLVINGFKFEDVPDHAIRIVGPGAANIAVTNNHTYNTLKSGISIRGVTGNADPGDYDNIRNVAIVNNIVELSKNSEVISVGSGAVNVDVAFNTLRIGDPEFGSGDEGISFKEGVRDSRIFGNVAYGLSDKAISIDGGSSSHDPLVSNIEIFDNIIHDVPTHGMWITTEGQGDVDGIHIHHNLIFRNDGHGILVYEHSGGRADGGTIRNILIEHNTVWGNGARTGRGGIRVDHPSATGVVIRDNIAWGNDDFDIEGDVGTTIDPHNLCRESALCDVTADPAFALPPWSFELLPGSPAIGAASDGGTLGAAG